MQKNTNKNKTKKHNGIETSTLSYFRHDVKRELRKQFGWARWFTPVIPALGGQGRQMTCGQEFETSLANKHGETPALLKVHNLARGGGRHL